ncbi:LOW QUALITY PROTEIN: hypothetical protein CFOL_v3_10390, partial [Cephalotus follicularis]
IFTNKKTTTTWITTDNKVIEAIHPLSDKIQINIQNSEIQVAPFKLQTENNNTPITTNETNKIIEQNNYTNKHLQTIGSLTRMETLIHKTSSDIKTKPQTSKPHFTPYTIAQSHVRQLTLNEVIQRLQSLIIPETPFPNLQIEERGNFTQASYQSGTIYELNIDGMNEYHIINKLQKMTMVSNAYKIKNASDKVVANLIAGFTGQLKGWWDNVLT